MKTNKVYKSEYDVSTRLASLGLTKEALIEVADAAFSARSNITEHHPTNGAGMAAWMEGVRQMRDSIVGVEWAASVDNGVEYIENTELALRIAFCNVDKAASFFDPKPVTPKKNTAERNCEINSRQTTLDFGDEFKHASNGLKTYYLFVGEDGTAELSLPHLCEHGRFFELVERVFILTPEDLDADLIDVSDDPEPEIEIRISRKT